MQTLPPTVAAFQILNDASKARQHSRRRGPAFQSAGGLNRSSSAIVQVAAMSSPVEEAVSAGQPSEARSTSVSVFTCGSENSQVPPPSHAYPSRQRIWSTDDGRLSATIVFKSMLSPRF